MKAWILRDAAPIEEHPLELVEVPTPRPGPHQVRLRVTVCGICRTDLHIAEGDPPARRTRLILGHEIVGVIDAVGNGVTRVQPGELAGVTWLGQTCGESKCCADGRENFCAGFRATGRDLDGGFAEYCAFRLLGVAENDSLDYTGSAPQRTTCFGRLSTMAMKCT